MSSSPKASGSGSPPRGRSPPPKPQPTRPAKVGINVWSHLDAESKARYKALTPEGKEKFKIEWRTAKAAGLQSSKGIPAPRLAQTVGEPPSTQTVGEPPSLRANEPPAKANVQFAPTPPTQPSPPKKEVDPPTVPKGPPAGTSPLLPRQLMFSPPATRHSVMSIATPGQQEQNDANQIAENTSDLNREYDFGQGSERRSANEPPTPESFPPTARKGASEGDSSVDYWNTPSRPRDDASVTPEITEEESPSHGSQYASAISEGKSLAPAPPTALSAYPSSRPSNPDSPSASEVRVPSEAPSTRTAVSKASKASSARSVLDAVMSRMDEMQKKMDQSQSDSRKAIERLQEENARLLEENQRAAEKARISKRPMIVQQRQTFTPVKSSLHAPRDLHDQGLFTQVRAQANPAKKAEDSIPEQPAQRGWETPTEVGAGVGSIDAPPQGRGPPPSDSPRTLPPAAQPRTVSLPIPALNTANFSQQRPKEPEVLKIGSFPTDSVKFDSWLKTLKMTVKSLAPTAEDGTEYFRVVEEAHRDNLDINAAQNNNPHMSSLDRKLHLAMWKIAETGGPQGEKCNLKVERALRENMSGAASLYVWLEFFRRGVTVQTNTLVKKIWALNPSQFKGDTLTKVQTYLDEHEKAVLDLHRLRRYTDYREMGTTLEEQLSSVDNNVVQHCLMTYRQEAHSARSDEDHLQAYQDLISALHDQIEVFYARGADRKQVQGTKPQDPTPKTQGPRKQVLAPSHVIQVLHDTGNFPDGHNFTKSEKKEWRAMAAGMTTDDIESLAAGKGKGKGKGGKGGKGGSKGGGKGPRDLSDVVCYNCEKKGHYARDCRQPKKDSKPGGKGTPAAPSVPAAGKKQPLAATQSQVDKLNAKFDKLAAAFPAFRK